VGSVQRGDGTERPPPDAPIAGAAAEFGMVWRRLPYEGPGAASRNGKAPGLDELAPTLWCRPASNAIARRQNTNSADGAAPESRLAQLFQRLIARPRDRSGGIQSPAPRSRGRWQSRRRPRVCDRTAGQGARQRWRAVPVDAFLLQAFEQLDRVDVALEALKTASTPSSGFDTSTPARAYLPVGRARRARLRFPGASGSTNTAIA